MKKRMDGFQKPLGNPAKAKQVRLAVISYTEDGEVVCSCGGWSTNHTRVKVREDAIDRHLAKRHGGRGIRL